MSISFSNALTVIALALVSSSTYSEIFTCEIDGKQVYQQLPCPIEIAEDAGCDENYDYSDRVDRLNPSFEDRYCYHLQLENLDAVEKQRLMKAYNKRRAEAQEMVEHELVQRDGTVLNGAVIQQENGKFIIESSDFDNEENEMVE